MPAEPTPAEIEAVKVLVAHQRRDIGSCICGWGVDTGDLGRSHPLHVWRELQRAVLPDHDARVRADERARVAEELGVELHRTADLDDVTPYQRRIAALEDLLVCYRTGRQPSEALHRRLEATRAALTTTPTTEGDSDA